MGAARSWPSKWPAGKAAPPGRTSLSDCAGAASTASSSSSPTIMQAFAQLSGRCWPKPHSRGATSTSCATPSITCRARPTTTACRRRWLYDRRSIEKARQDLAAWIAKWGTRYPKLVGWVEETIEETLTFYRLPRQHHKHLKSTNMLERLNEEIKRRTHVVRIFPNAEACLRLVRALAVETHENWLEAHRYLNMNDLREHKKTNLRKAA